MSQSSRDRELLQSGFRYALSLTSNRHDAEDLVQHACLRVFRSRGRLVNRAYLFTAIRNLYIDACRRRRIAEMEALPDIDPPSRGDHAKQAADREEVEVLLQSLRPIEREVLYLNCVEGFSATEIGELTGSPRGTVLSLLSRAKAKLSRERSPEPQEQGRVR